MKNVNQYTQEPYSGGAQCECVTAKGSRCIKPAQVKIVPDGGGPWVLLCNIHRDFSHGLIRKNMGLLLIHGFYMIATRKDGSGRTRTRKPAKVMRRVGRKLHNAKS
jgi:hypothetical protein